MEIKICKKCGIEKELDEFYNSKTNKDKHENICKLCKKDYYLKNKEQILNNTHSYYKKNSEYIKNYQKKYKRENSEKIKIARKERYEKNKENLIKTQKEYYRKNKQNIIKKQKTYREANVEKINEKKKQYRINNKKKLNNYFKNKYKNDDTYRFIVNIRNRIGRYIKNKGLTKNQNTKEIIGCDYKKLKEHLLQTFKNNYGYEWDGIEKVHIDHIIPLSFANNEEEILKLNNYKNLQLLKATDNLKKGKKLDWRLKEGCCYENIEC